MSSTWQQLILSQHSSIIEALQVIDRGARQIGLVVDDQQRLLGTVTDGDVRRALLKGTTLEQPVARFMNPAPRVATTVQSTACKLALMKQLHLHHLPLVDEQGQLVGLDTMAELLNAPRRFDNPVFLMAGGFGTRLRPLTNNCPKPLLRVGNKPILELILESYLNAGFHNFYISTHFMAEKIRDYFGDGSQWGCSIRYIHEETPLGTGGALSLLPRDEINLPLLMMNGDLLTDLNFAQLLANHEQQGGIATMCTREHQMQVPFGVINANGTTLTTITEKPTHSYQVNAGIYVLEPELLGQLAVNQHIDMPTLLQQQTTVHQRQVNLFPVEGNWLDIGRMDDFERAQEQFAQVTDNQATKVQALERQYA